MKLFEEKYRLGQIVTIGKGDFIIIAFSKTQENEILNLFLGVISTKIKRKLRKEVIFKRTTDFINKQSYMYTNVQIERLLGDEVQVSLLSTTTLSPSNTNIYFEVKPEANQRLKEFYE